jgi:translation elongation factor EF-4
MGPLVGDAKADFRGFLIDSWHDIHRGVITLVYVCNGCLRVGLRPREFRHAARAQVGDTIQTYHAKNTHTILEVGVLSPHQRPTTALRCGQVGYVIANIKETAQAKLGDTLYSVGCLAPVIRCVHQLCHSRL